MLFGRAHRLILVFLSHKTLRNNLLTRVCAWFEERHRNNSAK